MTDALLTAKDVYGSDDAMACELHQVAAKLQAGLVAAPRVAPVAASKVETAAYVNYGRVIAGCPDPYCGSAQAVSREDPRYFCVACGNAHVNGRWVKVAFHDDWDEIEALLLARPVPESRNWRHPESVATLEAENAERDL